MAELCLTYKNVHYCYGHGKRNIVHLNIIFPATVFIHILLAATIKGCFKNL